MALITASLPLIVVVTPATFASAKTSHFGIFELCGVPGDDLASEQSPVPCRLIAQALPESRRF